MYNEPTFKELSKIPKLYSTENISLREKKIYLHFFLADSDWYIAEYDGNDIFFGFVCINGYKELAEWAFFSFKELKKLKIKPSAIKHNTSNFFPIEVDNDLYFTPKKSYKIPLISDFYGW